MTNTNSIAIPARRSAPIIADEKIAARKLGVKIKETIFQPRVVVGKHQFSVYADMLDDGRVLVIASNTRGFGADIKTSEEFDEAHDTAYQNCVGPVSFNANAVEEFGKLLRLPTLEDLAYI